MTQARTDDFELVPTHGPVDAEDAWAVAGVNEEEDDDEEEDDEDDEDDEDADDEDDEDADDKDDDGDPRVSALVL